MSKSLDEMTDEERSQLFPIVLSEHKFYWRENFRKEKVILERAVGIENIVRINHIGSTAIPNLISKPTIDILIEIKNDTNIEKLIGKMQSVGYRYIDQPTTPVKHMYFIKGYTPQGFKGKIFHVHIDYSGDWDVPVQTPVTESVPPLVTPVPPPVPAPVLLPLLVRLYQ
jgi:GrpB-like predicted nucleotidyltransferase (UPF0157 family)